MGRLHDLLNAAEWFRYLTERLLLVPAARMLPLRGALLLADLAGAMDLLIPTAKGRTARSDIAAATGLRGRRGWVLAAQRCADPRRGLVYHVRAAAGRDQPADWRTVEFGTEAVRRMLAQGQSVILATFHSAGISLIRMKLLAGEGVSSDLAFPSADPKWQLSAFVLRSRLQLHWNMRARARYFGEPFKRYRRSQGGRVALMPNWWRREHDWSLVPARTASAQDQLLAKLAEPGSAVALVADVYWEKPSAHRRRFAGSPVRGFAAGAARMARIAQCPIVPMATALGREPLTGYLDCGPAIEPAAPDDKAADVRVTDELLDWLECAVARYPVQYGDLIGSERRWDADAGRWV